MKSLQILDFFFFFHFIFFIFIFTCYYCSINLKRQSEHSGLRPDTSNLVLLHLHSWAIKSISHNKNYKAELIIFIQLVSLEKNYGKRFLSHSLSQPGLFLF